MSAVRPVPPAGRHHSQSACSFMGLGPNLEKLPVAQPLGLQSPPLVSILSLMNLVHNDIQFI
jgi:hypothetical protein